MSKLQTTQGEHDEVMEMKSKLYLRITLLINYMVEKIMFVYAECSSVKHAASQFLSENMSQKKKKKRKERK